MWDSVVFALCAYSSCLGGVEIVSFALRARKMDEIGRNAIGSVENYRKWTKDNEENGDFCGLDFLICSRLLFNVI